MLIGDHCKRMSSTDGRKERMAWVGGASGETVAATVTRAKNIASDLVNLAYPGFSAYDPINPALGIKDCSAAMYAWKMLGMETAVAVNEPVTNKQVQVLGWQKALTKSEIETLHFSRCHRRGQERATACWSRSAPSPRGRATSFSAVSARWSARVSTWRATSAPPCAATWAARPT